MFAGSAGRSLKGRRRRVWAMLGVLAALAGNMPAPALAQPRGAFEPTPFDVLGIPKTATIAQIRDRYHELALKYHPDKGGGGSQQFVDLVEAYEKATQMAEEMGAERMETGGFAQGAGAGNLAVGNGEQKTQQLVIIVHSSPHPDVAACTSHKRTAQMCSSHGRWRWATRWVGPGDDNILGGGEDSHGPYTVHGKYTPETGETVWRKHYLEEKHDVVFAGAKDGDRIYGVFSDNTDKLSGIFTIDKGQ